MTRLKNRFLISLIELEVRLSIIQTGRICIMHSEHSLLMGRSDEVELMEA